MKDEHLKNKTYLNFLETTILLTWILIKLTLVATMTNEIAVEFVYAGF
tara:strand:+ start:96 stop:239 length:144 start_codon:yes stop_codon:yes gene_type:complete